MRNLILQIAQNFVLFLLIIKKKTNYKRKKNEFWRNQSQNSFFLLWRRKNDLNIIENSKE